VRTGYFVTDAFEIEAEVGAFGFVRSRLTVYGAGNLQLNWQTSRSVRPFILVGYGFTNGVMGHRYQASVGVLNLGTGLKFVFEKVVALRIEYRFQQFSGGESYEEITPSSRSIVPAADLQLHGFVVGASLFL
jgi:opacity protein-like surface antigen